MSNPVVSIIMGSKSDLGVMQEAADMLKELDLTVLKKPLETSSWVLKSNGTLGFHGFYSPFGLMGNLLQAPDGGVLPSIDITLEARANFAERLHLPWLSHRLVTLR